MDRQQIFTVVSDGLLAQGAMSLREVPGHGRAKLVKMLAYRGDFGRKCAAGFLIPDILYRKEMEGHLFAYKKEFDAVRVYMQISSDAIDLITHLQWVHDSCEPGIWREELASVGLRFGLDISTIWPRSNPAPASKRDK